MAFPNSIWFLLATIPIWGGLGCYALGRPGGGAIKSTLVRSSLMFAVLQWFQAMVFISEHHGLDRPAPYDLPLILGALVMQASWMDHFYEVAERKRGLHFKLSMYLNVGSILATLVVPELQVQVTSLPLLGLNMLILQSGAIWFLFDSHREAAPHSTRRNRLNYILGALVATMFIFIPVQVIAPSMGWLTDKTDTFCLTQFGLCIIICSAYSKVMHHYNLVKVELEG